MAAKTVIYTAIFGKKDALITPRYIPPDCDFVCFTDQPFQSDVWQVRCVVSPETDQTRSARAYKVLPHRFFPEYEVSVWVDGNVLVKGNIQELINTYLADANLAVFDHAAWQELPLATLAAHQKRLLWMESVGKHQEDAALMERQYDEYMCKNYPDTQGLAWTLTILRRHNKPDVISAMEAWWVEIQKWSKRDQLSFNYVAWKTGLKFNYIPLDGSDNSYTKRLNHYLPPHRKVYSYFLGAIKRLRRFIGRI